MHARPSKYRDTDTKNETAVSAALRLRFLRSSGMFCAVLLLATAAVSQENSAPNPPIAKKIHVTKSINGALLTDDYGWLRDRSNPEVHRYLEAENSYAELVTADEKPLADTLYRETLSHIKQTDTSVPYRKNGYWYYSRVEQGKQYPILCRKKSALSAPEEISCST
jgi:oligopeptidase B